MGIIEDSEKLKQELDQEDKELLKIVLFGQPGSGKSSLINAIVGKDVAKASQRTDTTTDIAEVCAYNGLVFVDLPGYGTAKFPENEFFSKFSIEEFDLFLCVFSGKFHKTDTEFFRILQEKGKVCLFVRSKADDIWQPNKTEEELKTDIIEDVHSQVGAPVQVYFTSVRREEGISELDDAILKAIGPAKIGRFVRTFKARTVEQLANKKEVCEKLITKYSGLAAANAINPIPGMGVCVDIKVIYDLFSKIRDAYGLSNESLQAAAPFLPLANNILKYALKEGIITLLKQYPAKEGLKEMAKYVPFVGQVIAATAGFYVVKFAGTSYLNDCHQVAKGILEKQLGYNQ